MVGGLADRDLAGGNRGGEGGLVELGAVDLDGRDGVAGVGGEGHVDGAVGAVLVGLALVDRGVLVGLGGQRVGVLFVYIGDVVGGVLYGEGNVRVAFSRDALVLRLCHCLACISGNSGGIRRRPVDIRANGKCLCRDIGFKLIAQVVNTTIDN